MTTIVLDGIIYEPDNPQGYTNYDKLGDPGVKDVHEHSELGDAMQELNDDSINRITKMSAMDMRAVLGHTEISSILAVDSLIQFKLLPITTRAFTQQKKRLSASLNGTGRKQLVEMATGKREQDIQAGGGMWNKLKTKFGGQQPRQ
jgi:hypothetical protein